MANDDEQLAAAWQIRGYLQSELRKKFTEIDEIREALAKLERREPRLRWDGSYVRQLRVNRGLSQEMTARIAGVSQSTISRLEKDGGTCRIRVAVSVAETLGVSISSLIPPHRPGSSNQTS